MTEVWKALLLREFVYRFQRQNCPEFDNPLSTKKSISGTNATAMIIDDGSVPLKREKNMPTITARAAE
jgi:hypothetical protein